MENAITAIEIGSKKIKLVIGFVLNGKVYSIYAITKSYSQAIDNFNISDPSIIINACKQLKILVDAPISSKYMVTQCLLALPPVDMSIYQNKQMTAVIGEENKISTIDIRNIYTLIRTGALKMNNINNTSLVSVVPEKFILANNKAYEKIPFGLVSNSLTIDAKIHVLPNRIVSSYESCIKQSGINVKRCFVSTYGATALINSEPNMPEDYLLIDIGSNITSVSFVGYKKLFSSNVFEWGGDNITEKIIEKFNINEGDAEKYKIIYGLDKRVMNFKAPICTTLDDYGNEVKHYSDELNIIIENELDIFATKLVEEFKHILANHDADYMFLPLIFIGGGSRLHGLKEFLEHKLNKNDLIFYTPKVLGARNPTYTNCLGLILANSINPHVYDESNPRVNQLTRDEK